MELWDSGIENDIVKPVGRKAIDLYGDEVIKTGNKKDVVIDGYKVNIVRNMCLKDDIFIWVFPLTAEMDYQINIEVGLPKGMETRWFVGIYYKKTKDDKWIDESNLELTTYEQKS